jgi:Nickel responsive protein SCO4226-like
MDTYVILRRGGWQTDGDRSAASERSLTVGSGEMTNDVRWIRSYVLKEPDGTVGMVCIYQASSEEAIREHAHKADLPIAEIIPVDDTVVVRPDPNTS